MESLEVHIGRCEKSKVQVILHYNKDKRSYDVDLFPRLLKKFLNDIMECMKRTPGVPNGNRFNNWWRLFWDMCTLDGSINNWARATLTELVYDNVKQETITWKLKYLVLTIVQFTKADITCADQYLQALISLMVKATEFPIQLTYYHAILALFDMHRVTSEDYLLKVMKQRLCDISDVDIIDPILHLADTDQYCRTVLSGINRQSRPSVIIYSIRCVEANLLYKKLLSPLKNGELWVDFNLKAETITLICQRSCLRTERPSIESEECDDWTTEILTINFDNISKITVRIWEHKESVQGKLLSFLLHKSPNYMYESSSAAVEQANKLFLNIEEGDELNRLLEILSEIFSTRFERLRKKPERQVSQQDLTQNGQSNLFLSPYTGRSVSLSSMTSLENSNSEEDTSSQVSVARKEMLSLRRSGTTIQSIHQIQTTIHTYVNSDNWPASNNQILPNQNPNKSQLSLTTDNDDEDDSVIESSQENKPSIKSTLQEKIDRAMGKYYTQPYKPQLSTTTLDSMYKQQFDYSSYKENQPVNTSQGPPSAANDVLSTVVNEPLRTMSRNQHETSHADAQQLVSVNKFSRNGPSHVNDRLKNILSQSDYDDESVLSDSSEKSLIISGNLRNRSNISRSLLKSSNVEQDTQDSALNFHPKLAPSRNNTVSSKSVLEMFPQNQSQRSQETLSSGAEFQPRNPRNLFGIPSSEYQPENVDTSKNMLPQKTPISLSQKSLGSNSSSIDFQRRVAKRNNPNWNSQNISKNRKPKLNKSLNLPPNDSSDRFERNHYNDSVEAILESALGNPELPKCKTFNNARLELKPIAPINNTSFINKPSHLSNSEVTHKPALLSSPQRDILLSSQKSQTPGTVNKKPLRQRTLSVRTPETILTNETRGSSKSSERCYLPQTPTFVTPISEISFQSARSCVSVSPSTPTNSLNNRSDDKLHLEKFPHCLDTQFDRIKHDYPSAPRNIENNIEDDGTAELVRDLDNDPVNMNDKHNTDEIINVQPTIRRKRGRPSKVCLCTDGNESINTTVCSTTSTNKPKRRQKKSTKQCYCDPSDELNCSIKIPDAKNQEAEMERKRILRFTTRSRFTKPPIRLSDELNKTYLNSVNGQIRRKQESGYCTDTVMYRKSSPLRARRINTTMLNKTWDVNPTNNRNGIDFGSLSYDNDTCTNTEQEKKQKKKKNKRTHTEYDSSVINTNKSIRLRLSRRNSMCDMLTQDPVSQGETQQCPQSQESQGWDEVFNEFPAQRKSSAVDLINDAEPIDKSKWDKYHSFKNTIALNQMLKTDIEEISTCDYEEQKASVQLLYDAADSFMTPLQIKAKLEQNFANFLHDR